MERQTEKPEPEKNAEVSEEKIPAEGILELIPGHAGRSGKIGTAVFCHGMVDGESKKQAGNTENGGLNHGHQLRLIVIQTERHFSIVESLQLAVRIGLFKVQIQTGIAADQAGVHVGDGGASVVRSHPDTEILALGTGHLAESMKGLRLDIQYFPGTFQTDGPGLGEGVPVVQTVEQRSSQFLLRFCQIAA